MIFQSKVLSRFNLTGNKKKIFKNVYWAVLGKIINIISSLLIGVLVARYLGPENFGLMNYVISYVTLFSILANFGLDNIEIRELSKKESDKNIILGTSFLIRLVFSLITILFIITSLISFESDSETVLMVVIYSMSLIPSSLNVIRNYFTSIVLNEYVVKSEIIRTLIGAGIKIILLFYHFTLIWFIIATVFDFVLIASGYLYSYRRKVGFFSTWKFDMLVAKKLIKESFPLLLSGTAIIIYQKIDQVMIRNMIDNASVGQFAVASRITEIAIFVPTVVAQTITPLLIKARQDNIELYNRKRQQFMDIMVWSGIGMSFLMCITAYPAIKILFGEKYIDAIPVLQIMAWKTVFIALFSASGQIIVIEGIQRYAVFRNLIGCIVSIMLNIILIPKLQIIGSAIATVITMAFTGYLSHKIISQYLFVFKMQNMSFFSGIIRIKGNIVKYNNMNKQNYI